MGGQDAIFTYTLLWGSYRVYRFDIGYLHTIPAIIFCVFSRNPILKKYYLLIGICNSRSIYVNPTKAYPPIIPSICIKNIYICKSYIYIYIYFFIMNKYIYIYIYVSISSTYIESQN